MKGTCRSWVIFATLTSLGAGGAAALAQGAGEAPGRTPAATAASGRAEDQYNFATELFGKKFYELAIQQYEKFIADFPQHPNVFRARIRVGEAYLRLDRHQQAVDAYRRALDQKPDSNFRLELLVGLGLAHFHLKEYPQSETALREAWKLADQVNDEKLGPISANWLGESLFQQKKWTEAAAAFQSVLQWPNDPLAAQALYSMGFCRKETGHDEAAIGAWLEVVSKYKDHPVAPEANFRAGDAQLRKKEFGAAANTFMALLTRYPQSEFAVKAQLGLGWVAFHQKEYAKAREAFERTASKYPGTPEGKQARLRAADCFYYMKDYAGAAKAYEAVARGEDADLAREAKYWLSVCRVHLGDEQAAMELLAQIASDTKDPKLALNARLRLGELQLKNGKTAEAAATYRAALPLIPADDPVTADEAAYGLGVALYREKRVAEAEQQFSAILARSPQTATAPRAALALAQCRIDAGQWEAAAQALGGLLQKEQSAELRAPALWILGQARLQAKRPEEAVAPLRELVEKFSDSPHAVSAASALALVHRQANRGREADEITTLLATRLAGRPGAAAALLDLAENRRAASDWAAATALYEKVLGAKPDAEVAAVANGGLAICLAAGSPSGTAPDASRINAALAAMANGPRPKSYQAEVRHAVGWGYEQAKRPNEALEQYRQALALDPDSKSAADLHFRCGTLLAELKRYTEAIDAFKVVTDRFPTAPIAPNALYELGWALTDAGRKEAAKPVFERLAERHPDHELGIDAAFRVAEAEFEAKQFTHAANRYRKVASSPKAGQLGDKAWYKLGWCLREMQESRGAGEAFGKLVSLYPNSDLAREARLREAEALIEAGDLPGAASRLQQVMNGRGSSAEDRQLQVEAQVTLAEVYLKQGDGAKALRTAQPVATSEHRFLGSRAQLVCAEALFAQKDWKGAVAAYVRVTTMQRTQEVDAQAQFRIGECCAQLGDGTKAAEYWQSVLAKYPNTEWGRLSRQRLGR